MDLKNCAAVLFVKDAGKAKDFYVNVLGLTVIADFGGLNFVFREGFAVWQPMPENIVQQRLGGNMYDKSLTSRFELCFETGDIDAVYERLKAEGVTFLHEVNTELWGQRNIRFYDHDGHLLEVGEAMPVFLARIYEEENRDIEATAKRTYMQADDIKHILSL